MPTPLVSAPLISAEAITKRFPDRPTLFHRHGFQALHGVDVAVGRGETLVLVGESGSGKSTLGRCLALLETPTTGTMTFDGKPITGRALDAYRRRIAIVFQNPFRSLNPRMRIGRAIAEPLRLWDIVPAAGTAAEVARLIESVGLPAAYAQRFPHELSGGERQRIAIARALAVRPEFLVADEAVSSLDVSAAAEVLNLMMRLKQQGLSCLFITHDLSVARVLADRVAVMQSGRIVETGTPEEVLDAPQHDYTKLLLASRLLAEEEEAAAPEVSVQATR